MSGCKYWDAGWCYKEGSDYHQGCVGSENCKYMQDTDRQARIAAARERLFERAERQSIHEEDHLTKIMEKWKGLTPEQARKKFEQAVKERDIELKNFVDSLYEDGKKPCERFGLTHEGLGELDDLYGDPHEPIED